jgi:hypothetical protein
MAMSPQTYAMIASLVAGFAGNKFGGGSDKAAKSQEKQSEIQRKSLERLYAMSKDGTLDQNPEFFQIGNYGSNLMDVLHSMDFSTKREMDLLSQISGLVEGTGSFGTAQMQSNALSESALAEQLAPLIQDLLRGAGTKTTGIAGSLGEVSEASQAAWNEPY